MAFWRDAEIARRIYRNAAYYKGTIGQLSALAAEKRRFVEAQLQPRRSSYFGIGRADDI